DAVVGDVDRERLRAAARGDGVAAEGLRDGQVDGLDDLDGGVRRDGGPHLVRGDTRRVADAARAVGGRGDVVGDGDRLRRTRGQVAEGAADRLARRAAGEVTGE